MTAKEYLNQAYYLDRKIKLDIIKLNALKSSVCCRGISYESDGSKRVPSGNSVENALLKIAEYEEKINAEIDKLCEVKEKTATAIELLPDTTQQEVLLLRYLAFKKWDEIAEEMNYSTQWVFSIHSKGLKEISKVLKEKSIID